MANRMAYGINRSIVFLLILAGLLAMGLGLIIATWGAWHLLSGSLKGQTLIYSSKQIELVTDVTKTLIPTVTGFIVLMAPAIGYLKNQQYLVRERNAAKVLVTLVLVVTSLGMWVATLTAMINCASPFDQLLGQAMELDRGMLDSLNMYYFLGIRAAELAIISFFVAVDVAVLLATDIIGSNHEPSTRS